MTKISKTVLIKTIGEFYIENENVESYMLDKLIDYVSHLVDEIYDFDTIINMIDDETKYYRKGLRYYTTINEEWFNEYINYIKKQI